MGDIVEFVLLRSIINSLKYLRHNYYNRIFQFIDNSLLNALVALSKMLVVTLCY